MPHPTRSHLSGPGRKFRFLVASVLLTAAAAAGAMEYKFIVLGDLGTVWMTAGYGINNAGQVVGVTRFPQSVDHATLWNGATPTDLAMPYGAGSATATDINQSGQITGWSGPLGAVEGTATVWRGGVPIVLGSLGGASAGMAINDGGQVAGYTRNSQGSYRATVWNGSTPTDLGTLGGTSSWASDINNAGQIAGWSDTGQGSPHAVVWSGQRITDLDPGRSSFYSVAHAINAAGQVVGQRETDRGVFEAALWNGTTATTLNAPGDIWGVAFGLNNSGQVVGWSQQAGGNQHATLWNGRDEIDLSRVLDPRTEGRTWTIYDARAINDEGWITGRAFNQVDNRFYAYLLQVTPAPEPGTLALMALGLGVLGFKARLRSS